MNLQFYSDQEYSSVTRNFFQYSSKYFFGDCFDLKVNFILCSGGKQDTAGNHLIKVSILLNTISKRDNEISSNVQVT